MNESLRIRKERRFIDDSNSDIGGIEKLQRFTIAGFLWFKEDPLPFSPRHWPSCLFRNGHAPDLKVSFSSFHG